MQAHKFIPIMTKDLPQFRPSQRLSEDDVDRFLQRLESRLTTVPKVERGQNRWSWTLQHIFMGSDRADADFVRLLAEKPWDEAKASFKKRFGNGGDEITACPDLLGMRQKPHQTAEAFADAFKAAVNRARTGPAENEDWTTMDRLYTFLFVKALRDELRTALLMHEDYSQARKDFNKTAALASRISEAQRASSLFLGRDQQDSTSDRRRARNGNKSSRQKAPDQRQNSKDARAITDGDNTEGKQPRPDTTTMRQTSPKKQQRSAGRRNGNDDGPRDACSRCQRSGHKLNQCKSRFDQEGLTIKSPAPGIDHPSEYSGCNACGSKEHASWSPQCKASVKGEARISGVATTGDKSGQTVSFVPTRKRRGTKRKRPSEVDSSSESEEERYGYGCSLCGGNHDTKQCEYNHKHDYGDNEDRRQ